MRFHQLGGFLTNQVIQVPARALWISSCKASQRRAIARMAALAEAVGEVISPGLRAATWRTKAICPRI